MFSSIESLTDHSLSPSPSLMTMASLARSSLLSSALKTTFMPDLDPFQTLQCARRNILPAASMPFASPRRPDLSSMSTEWPVSPRPSQTGLSGLRRRFSTAGCGDAVLSTRSIPMPNMSAFHPLYEPWICPVRRRLMSCGVAQSLSSSKPEVRSAPECKPSRRFRAASHPYLRRTLDCLAPPSADEPDANMSVSAAWPCACRTVSSSSAHPPGSLKLRRLALT
mmetsp:Transcript_28399/g.64067  ORF Transcript_28399/g.64067 Transcript_28399/m.64067 type:complete len:223 (+) Transcript_28399:336-1004(+)